MGNKYNKDGSLKNKKNIKDKEFLAGIERGRKDMEEGRVLTHEQLLEEMRKWSEESK
jgi:predicted transcriptional regulator